MSGTSCGLNSARGLDGVHGVNGLYTRSNGVNGDERGALLIAANGGTDRNVDQALPSVRPPLTPFPRL
jgi:hypothetical protein